MRWQSDPQLCPHDSERCHFLNFWNFYVKYIKNISRLNYYMDSESIYSKGAPWDAPIMPRDVVSRTATFEHTTRVTSDGVYHRWNEDLVMTITSFVFIIVIVFLLENAITLRTPLETPRTITILWNWRVQGSPLNWSSIMPRGAKLSNSAVWLFSCQEF